MQVQKSQNKLSIYDVILEHPCAARQKNNLPSNDLLIRDKMSQMYSISSIGEPWMKLGI